MDEFTIYCTPEQTKKAYELGAPICKCAKDNNDPDLTVDGWGSFDGYWLLIPTAEQMIGWLEVQGLIFLTGMDDEDKFFFNLYHSEGHIEVREYDLRKEATLAAINEALDYLIQTRK